MCTCRKEKARWGQREKVAICKPGRQLSPGRKFLIPLSGECAISSVLSHHSKNLKWQTNVTAQLQLNFILQAKESTPLRREGGSTPKERPQSILLPLSIHLSPPPLSLPYVKWASQEGCLFRLRFSLWSSKFSSFFFLQAFSSLSFSHLHFELLFPILTTYHLHSRLLASGTGRK